MSEIEIRAAEPFDAEAIHEIMSCPVVMANTMQLPWRSFERHREWLNQRLADGHLLVAVVDGRHMARLRS